MISENVSRAAAAGRGLEVFRPGEAAAFLGVSVKEIKAAMRTRDLSEGKRGLAHFKLGKGSLIRRGALEAWMMELEAKQAKGA
jgi:hypothetical protein